MKNGLKSTAQNQSHNNSLITSWQYWCKLKVSSKVFLHIIYLFLLTLYNTSAECLQTPSLTAYYAYTVHKASLKRWKKLCCQIFYTDCLTDAFTQHNLKLFMIVSLLSFVQADSAFWYIYQKLPLCPITFH